MTYDLDCCGHSVEEHERDRDRNVVWCRACDNRATGCYPAPGGTAVDADGDEAH